MADALVSGFLDINNGGAPFDDIALKVYAGMILEAFNKETTTEGRVVTRTISSGKSAQFPVIGRAATLTHARGQEIVDQAIQVNSNEKIIAIEDILMAPIFIDILDEAKSHFDIRRPYATQQGQALSEESDRRSFMSIAAAAATTTPNFTGGDAGTVDTAATMGTDVAVLKAAIYDAAEALDMNSVPSSERTLWLSPAQYYLLLNDGEFIDRDFNDGSNGSRSHAVMRNASDFEVVKTTNLPTVDESANTALPTEQRLAFNNLVALAAHSSAAGMVSLMGLMFESEYDINRQGHLLVAKYARGFGSLRPEASVALATAAL
jgi:hypothetical protein